MIRIEIDPFPSEEALTSLFAAAWGSAKPAYAEKVLPRSLLHIGAFSDERLVGFVNVAWDGDAHAFLLDTTVDPQFQRQGIATRMVEAAAAEAQPAAPRGCMSILRPNSTDFYRGCGFSPTAAGLIQLR